jgi:hypothetical protein
VRLERQRVSTDQLWQDLQQIVRGTSGKAYQLSLFGPQIDVQEEKILFGSDLTSPKIVNREDIEDLWNVLRIRGTISDADIPKSIRAEGLEDWLFDLLGRLAYIRPLNIRKRGDLENGRGLQYVPQPETAPVQEIDVLI